MFIKRKLSNTEFKIMQGIMKFIDVVHPFVPARAKSFGIQAGMTVVDYGCGPGRFTVEFACLTGEKGIVYAVDLLEIALQETKNRIAEKGLTNVMVKLAQGYDSGIPHGTADMICAVDMFHHVEPVLFLKEVERIAKTDGVLVISGGHMTRSRVKKAVASSGLWALIDENNNFLKYTKNNNLGT
jgi:cyclopropane fatty-acyl-phospholipid synthase-like methyltransferase